MGIENYYFDYFSSRPRVTGGAPPADGALGGRLYRLCQELVELSIKESCVVIRLCYWAFFSFQFQMLFVYYLAKG